MLRRKNSSAAVVHASCTMSISADGALSSQKRETGRRSAAMKPPSRPSTRPKYQKHSKTVIVAAIADGSRADHGVTSPNGQLTTAMAAYMPGGFVNRGWPYSVGTTQLPL